MKKGFTLIELLVGMLIFIIVIVVVLNLFMTGLKGQRKVIAQQDVQDNARYLLGFIAKELRMSRIMSVSPDSLQIERHDGTEVVYTFNDAEKTIKRDGYAINSENVLVTGEFSSLGVGAGDGQQPRITINIRVEKTGDKPEENAEIIIQSTLSQRNLDL